MLRVIVILCVLKAVSMSSLSEADFNRLPRLFYADNYERCLAQPGALYCMGVFRFTPTVSPHYVYEALKEHASSKYSFDRTLLHRGYCVTSRCSNYGNGTSLADRFEKCVQKWARPLKMTTRLETLHYCRGPEDRLQETVKAQEDGSPHQLFLKITYSLLVMNIIGTVYDLMGGNNNKRNKLLLAWSARDNWRRLLKTNSDAKTLDAVQGYRILLMWGVMLGHVMVYHYVVYTKNPQILEYISNTTLNKYVINCSAGVEVFLTCSTFFLSHNLLNSKEKALNFTHLPKILVKRIARITPVYFYVLLFAVSWWPLLRDGPMWQLLVSKESTSCKEQFWYHLFYINNYVDKDSHCLIHTWYMAADMQVYIFGAIVTLAIARFKLKPLPILSTMFITSCVLNTVLAYIFKWKQILFYSTPENHRKLYIDEESFTKFYISTLGSLPAGILGLYVAHKHYYEEIEGKQIQFPKIFYLICRMLYPIVTIWFIASTYISGNNLLATSISLGLERPVCVFIFSIKLYAFCKGISGPLTRFMSSHVFCVLGRLSLSVMLIHWCVITYIVAGRATFYTSYFEILSDKILACVWSLFCAFPLTVLLEMPVYRSISAVY